MSKVDNSKLFRGIVGIPDQPGQAPEETVILNDSKKEENEELSVEKVSGSTSGNMETAQGEYLIAEKKAAVGRPRKEEDTVHKGFYITKKQAKALKIKTADGGDMSEHVRNALNDYLADILNTL